MNTSTEVVRIVLICAWALAGIVLTLRRPRESLGPLALGAAALGLAGSLVHSLAPLALGLLPAAAQYLLLALPDGSLGTASRRTIAAAGLALGIAAAVILSASRPEIPAWPVLTLSALAAVTGSIAFAVRYRTAHPAGQRRMRWLAWGAIVSGGLSIVVFGLHALVCWPHDAMAGAAATTILIPISLVAGPSARFDRAIDPLLVSTISLAGLTAL